MSDAAVDDTTPSPDGPQRKPSPYVGPRAIRDGEPFFGREMEATALINKLLPGGITLLHAPSGAGKTSLIQASVVPWFRDEGFQVCANFAPRLSPLGVEEEPRFSALRVNLPPPDDLDVSNRYVFSLVNGLVGRRVDRHVAARMTIEDALSQLAGGAERRQLVVIDQLEEALTLDRNDRQGQRELFKQLGSALRRGRRWALLAVREDYMGELDRYRQFFPNELRTTFRLDFLDADAARRAIQLPAKERDVTFTGEAADQLVSDLRRVRAGSAEEAVVYPYVEPVLLQVICNNLWRILSRKRQADFTIIEPSDLDVVRPYTMSLSKYYRAAVRKAAAKAMDTDTDTDIDIEREIRDWIARELLTAEMTRSPTRSLPQVGACGLTIVMSLQRQYLLRDDPRPGGTFWELSHDMLVQPIIEDNRSWRLSNLRSWQIVAEEWNVSDRDSKFLLTGPDLRLAQADARALTPNPMEAAFLAASARLADEETRRAKMEAQMIFSRYRVSTYRLALICSTVLNVVFIFAFLIMIITS